VRQRFALVPVKQNRDFPFCLRGWVYMGSELFATGFAGAHSHSGLALYDAETTVLHMKGTPVWQGHVFNPWFQL